MSRRAGRGRKTPSARRAPRPENRPTIPASLDAGDVGGRVIVGEYGGKGGDNGVPCWCGCGGGRTVDTGFVYWVGAGGEVRSGNTAEIIVELHRIISALL